MTPDVRLVACGHCNVSQPNPQPFSVGQEVLLHGGSFGMKYGRVVACSGPDTIEIEVKEKRTVHRLEDLLPVLALPADAREGERVYVDQDSFDWKPTWLVSVTGGTCVVKNDNLSFQDDFFDKQMPTSAVRVPMRKEPPRRLGPLQRIMSWAGRWPFLTAVVVFVLGLFLTQYLGC